LLSFLPIICFLDEKWFYARSDRKKSKYVPPGPGETEADAALPLVTCASHRFPAKVKKI
jgi:hypothetical protein